MDVPESCTPSSRESRPPGALPSEGSKGSVSEWPDRHAATDVKLMLMGWFSTPRSGGGVCTGAGVGGGLGQVIRDHSNVLAETLGGQVDGLEYRGHHISPHFSPCLRTGLASRNNLLRPTLLGRVRTVVNL